MNKISMPVVQRCLSGLLILAFIATVAGSCKLFDSGYEEYEFQPLAFPFLNPNDIVRMAAFGIPNWSGTEPHGGIDLIISESLSSARIISPSNGTVSHIGMSENPYSHPVGQLLLHIDIYINSDWLVSLVIEPGTTNETIKSAQRAAVLVSEDQAVAVGTPIVDLLVGEHGYPHLHYSVYYNDEVVCAYTYSSTSARLMFENIAVTRTGNNLPDGNICYGSTSIAPD
jgi:murein DD-endopeptidase MepM/ murein hydrolase activator NlpD